MKNKHILKIREVDRKIFEAIKKGKKKIETRAATEKYRDIKEGDIIEFICGPEKIIKKVVSSEIFKTIPSLLHKYKPKEINPNINSLKETREMYYNFPNYRDKIKKYGLIALKIK